MQIYVHLSNVLKNFFIVFSAYFEYIWSRGTALLQDYMCAKTQIIRRIHVVWSVFSVYCIVKYPRRLYAGSEDSDLDARIRRLVWVFAGRTCSLVGNDIFFKLQNHEAVS